MDKAAYRQVQEQLFMLAGMARAMDVDQVMEFIRANGHSLIVAPILAPTTYMAGHERLEASTELASTFLKFHAAATEFIEVVARTEGKAQRARDEAAAILEERP